MDTKDEIINAAFKNFSKRGYGVSMSDIAKEVGIKTPSLYSHFGSKDEILYITIEKEIRKYSEFLHKVYENHKGEIPEQALKTIFFTIIGYFKESDTLRFWKNILMIDQDELRKKCSEEVFNLEMYHLGKLLEVFKQSSFKNNKTKEEVEGNALQFISMIQAALEIELLFFHAENKVEEYISKIWTAYSKNIFN